MGNLSSKYRFDLKDQAWCVSLRYRSGRYHYAITIDEQPFLDVQPEQTLVEMIDPVSFSFIHDDTRYRVKISPVSIFDYGVHVYANDAIIYRHKDREFKAMPRLRWCLEKMDANPNKDDRPFWKTLVECLIIGGVIGASTGLLRSFLGDSVLPSGSSITPYVVFVSVLMIALWPKKWRFIR